MAFRSTFIAFLPICLTFHIANNSQEYKLGSNETLNINDYVPAITIFPISTTTSNKNSLLVWPDATALPLADVKSTERNIIPYHNVSSRKADAFKRHIGHRRNGHKGGPSHHVAKNEEHYFRFLKNKDKNIPYRDERQPPSTEQIARKDPTEVPALPSPINPSLREPMAYMSNSSLAKLKISFPYFNSTKIRN